MYIPNLLPSSPYFDATIVPSSIPIQLPDSPVLSSAAQHLDLPNADSPTIEANNSNGNVCDLPSYPLLDPPNFNWGDLNGSEFEELVNEAYNQIVHWRHNLFDVPKGKAGNKFVAELCNLLQQFSDGTAMERISLRAAMTIPALLPQKPHRRSSTHDHIQCLERRLNSWHAGNIPSLLHEGRSLQRTLDSFPRRQQDDTASLSRAIQKLVTQGNIKRALQLITEKSGQGYLPLHSKQPDGRSVKEHLLEKHPSPQPLHPSAISDQPPIPAPHPTFYDRIDGPFICSVALQMNGSAGPSGLDAKAWKRICCSFHNTSSDLCKVLAKIARKLCTLFVDPQGIEAFTACRLIALDKNPGVRPIGIGETLRRLISKAILKVTKDEIHRTVGSLQLCAGQDPACESGVLAMEAMFENDKTEAVMLVDASNAFNSLNREAALKNIHILCPAIAPILINTYRTSSKLFIDGEYILSQEGTTQGDPLAMAMYAIATLPLVHKLKNEAVQIWYADDAAAGGKSQQLKRWWDCLTIHGPTFGYFPNPCKTWIITKPQHLHVVEPLFKDSGVNITTEGQKYLGTPIGSISFSEEFVRKKVKQWTTELKKLSDITNIQPQAAYTILTRGLMSQWTYLMRTVHNLDRHLQPLEEILRCNLLPALTGRPTFSDLERDLLALPACLGGLGIPIPTSTASGYFADCSQITAPLVKLINEQIPDYTQETHVAQLETKSNVRLSNRNRIVAQAKALKDHLPKSKQMSLEQASEKGASSWLTSLPLRKYGFDLHKQSFRDALCLRYGWTPPRTASHCPCGHPFSVNHAFSCTKGALPTLRHNAIRDITVQLLTEVCPNVGIEPQLQPLSGESFRHKTTNTDDCARLDIKVQNFWDKSRRTTYFDVRVFNAYAPSNCMSTEACYRKHELEKRRKYEQQIIEIEHGTFTPLVFSSSGGWAPATTIAFKRLANLLAEKQGQSNNSAMSWIRCRMLHSLVESAVACIRAPRSSYHTPIKINTSDHPLDLLQSEVQMQDD